MTPEFSGYKCVRVLQRPRNLPHSQPPPRAVDMPRPTWTTELQAAFLTERKGSFIDAQASGTTRAFLNATTEAFLAKWPILAPTDAELAEEQGDYDAVMANKKAKIRSMSARVCMGTVCCSPSCPCSKSSGGFEIACV